MRNPLRNVANFQMWRSSRKSWLLQGAGRFERHISWMSDCTQERHHFRLPPLSARFLAVGDFALRERLGLHLEINLSA